MRLKPLVLIVLVAVGIGALAVTFGGLGANAAASTQYLTSPATVGDVTKTVTAVDADSITLTLANGDEMTFALDGDTTYHEATDAVAADVAVGDDVSVKVDGDGRIRGGTGGSTTPELTAGDVTVAR